ncbi:MAG: DUF2066 domain-containing protein [Pseudomonadota bacterium]|nr:DUF2066 domain-containing protein [Pseudomonadota bacterium]
MALWLFATSLPASNLDDLYQATVPVADRTDVQRDAVTETGLTLVLQKLTGVKAAQIASMVQGASLSAQRALISYRYLEGDTAASAIRLTYDPQVVERIAVELGLPYWGTERPLALVWLALDDGGRRLLNAEDRPVGPAVQQRAQERGIPLMLPLLDLEDLDAMTPGTVWMQDHVVLQRASERYAVTLVGAIHVRSDPPGGADASWTVIIGDHTSRGTVEAPDVAEAAVRAVDAMADAIFAEYARRPQAGSGRPYEVTISGIRRLDHYQAVARQLESLDGVVTVRPARVAGDSATFQISYFGTAEDLRKRLLLERIFIASEPDRVSPSSVGDSVQRFHFVTVP